MAGAMSVSGAVAREGTRAPLVMLTGGAGHRVDGCRQGAKVASAFVSRGELRFGGQLKRNHDERADRHSLSVGRLGSRRGVPHIGGASSLLPFVLGWK